MSTHFSFIYPVIKRTTQLNRLGGQLYNHVTDLLVKGVAFVTNASLLNNISHQYKFEIKEILVEGKDVYPSANFFESIDNIKAACLNHIHSLMYEPKLVAKAPNNF